MCLKCNYSIFRYIGLLSNYISKPPKHHLSSIQLQSSFMDWPHIWPIITDLKQRENNKENLYECDYSLITSVILPYYFHVGRNTTWVITPEYNYLEANHPDYTIFSVNRHNNYTLDVHVVVELKSKTGDSWFKLLEQMYAQAEVAKNSNGKLWAIGQKGFEICFFEFNVTKYVDQDPDCFTNFKPLNLNNFSEPELDRLKIKYEHCNDNGFARVGLIKWRLDNRDHIAYIDHMFQYIRSRQP